MTCPGVCTPCPTVTWVPNQPATPGRSVRVPDELWESAIHVACDRDETVTDVIIRALTRYVRTYGDSNGDSNGDSKGPDE